MHKNCMCYAHVITCVYSFASNSCLAWDSAMPLSASCMLSNSVVDDRICVFSNWHINQQHLHLLMERIMALQ